MVSFIERKSTFSNKDLYMIASILYMENKSGINITDSLECIISGFSNNKKRNALEEIKKQIFEGKSLSEALKENKHMFKNEFIMLVEGGEYSGNMEKTLKVLKNYYEEKIKIESKIKTSTLYPIILFIIFNISIIGILGFVIPRFADILPNSNMDRGVKIIFSIARFINRNFIFSIIFIFLIYIFGYLVIRDLHLYKYLPHINKVITLKYDIFTIKIMNILYQSGISIRQILDNLIQSIDNKEYKTLLIDVKLSVVNGNQLWKAFYITNKLPIQSINIIQSGEKSGNLCEALDFVEEILREKLNKATTNIITFIQPAMIVFFGFILLIFLLTIVMPIFSSIGDIGV